MLTHKQIIPYLDTYVFAFTHGETNNVSRYCRVSLCHRLVAHVLLLHHYQKGPSPSVKSMILTLRFSEETIRRAVRDGIKTGVIQEVRGQDKRKKYVIGSTLLVEVFESMHVESTDDQQNKERNDEPDKRTHTSKRKTLPSGHNAGERQTTAT